MQWSELVKRLTAHKTTGETLAEWTAMTKAQKDSRKDVGCFIGGSLRDDTRTKGSVASRSVLTLDADHASLTFWDDFILLFDIAGCAYQTHSWTPEKPKYRLCLPLSRAVDPELFRAISWHYSCEIGEKMFDHTCHQPERLMHYPSLPLGAPHVVMVNDAPFIDVDEWLVSHPAWTDISTWPAVTGGNQAGVRVMGASKKDPREVQGIVGQFCRTYTVPEAIEKFIPDVYVATEEADRWTFVAGSSTKGLQIFDDGLLCISHHATDPAGDGHEYNAYDLVRIHLFGEQDTNPDLVLSDRPSSRAMRSLAEEDPEVFQLLRAETDAAAQVAFDDFEETGEANPRAMFFRRVPGMRAPVYTPSLAYAWYRGLFPLRLVDGVVHRYDTGYYIPTEVDMRRRLTQALGEEYASNRVNEALACTRDSSEELQEPMGAGGFLNVNNGLLDTRTGELGPHCEENAGIVRVSWDYNPEATCPAVDKFLSIYAPGYEETLWYMMAYCLIPTHRFEKAFMLVGGGGNGKGTLLNLFTELLGSRNVSHVSLQKLESNTFAASGLVGMLANIQLDLPAKAIEAEGVFKQIVSNDPVNVERKNQQGFTTKIPAKLMFSANNMVGTKDTSDGFYRRWCIVPFNVKMNDDELRAQMFKEIEGVLAKAVRYAKELWGMRDFPSQGIVSDYRANTDSVYGFLVERCVLQSDCTESLSAVYNFYKEHCALNHHIDLGKNKFGAKFQQLTGLTQGRDTTTRYWKGVKLVREWENDDVDDLL